MPYHILGYTAGTGAPLNISDEPTTTYCTSPSQTSDSFWSFSSGSTTTWDGSKWTKAGTSSSALLVPTGGWEVGVRPTQVEITFYKPTSGNGSNGQFRIRDTSNVLIGELDFSSFSFDTQHTASTALTFGANDIGSFEIREFLYSGMEVRCIKFS